MGERPTVLEALTHRVKQNASSGICYMDLQQAMPPDLPERLNLNGNSTHALAETWIHMAHACDFGVVFKRKRFDEIAKDCALDSLDLRDNPPLSETQLQTLFDVSLEEGVFRRHLDVDGKVSGYVLSYLLHPDLKALSRMI